MLKRVADFVVALILLVFLSPVMAAVGLLGMLFHGRPILFRQLRLGMNKKPFLIIKFRTMSAASAVSDGDESARVTKFGEFLRRTSLDEIPSLWNVVRGDLSFVGPRPLLAEYAHIYSDRHASRHVVRPGVTGLAQVAGRNLLGWRERLDLDAWYVENQSALLDLKIFFQTFVVVFRSLGVNQEDGTTMVRLAPGYETEE